MSETDPFAGQWRDLTSVLPTLPAEATPAATANPRVDRIQARAAIKRADRHDAVQTWAEKRQARRADRRADRADRRELRAEKQADRTQRAQRARTHVLAASERALVTFPILAPMAVAWTGQSQFAVTILGWAFLYSILYAAAYELTTVYWAWLYHQARTDGDSGWEYRLGTWVFASGAAVQQWWHYSDNWHATPRAVTYSVMSAVGVLLWEGRARLIHRRKLRSEGKLPPARPTIGLSRWVRYPVRSWTTWSLITLEGHTTLDAAWTAADEHLRTAQLDRAEARETARLDRANRTGPRRAKRSTPRSAVTAGSPAAATVQSERTAIPARAVTGPGRTVQQRTALPARAANADRAAAVQVDLTKKAQPTAGPDRAAAGVSGPVQPPAGPLTLNATEQAAIDRLRSTKRSISKRSIADVVRNELGQSIGSDRAAEIARHFRTLRSAA